MGTAIGPAPGGELRRVHGINTDHNLEICHGKKIFEVGEQGREARDGAFQKRQSEKRQGRTRRKSKKPQAGDRDRALEGAQKRQEGSQKAPKKITFLAFSMGKEAPCEGRFL